MTSRFRIFLAGVFVIIASLAGSTFAQSAPMDNSASPDAFLNLMQSARKHAQAQGSRFTPALSPEEETVLGPTATVDVKAMHAAGFRVVPWTVDDPEKMRGLIRERVDGIISDRPDLLQRVLKEERQAAGNSADEQSYFARFDVEGHRGGRGLRPENTLPAFESGLDNLITGIETDTGVTTDRVSLIWHDQFLNPASCRRADGSEYTLRNKMYIQDISMKDAQREFICDKLRFGTEQKNDLSLSPVAVAFARQEGMISPYAPTNVPQLYRFVRFYVEYYRSGAGKHTAEASARWKNAERVRFNLETKIMPSITSGTNSSPELEPNHTVDPNTFVSTLCGAIKEYHMEARSDVQSFDFRTLILVEEHYPNIATYYLTDDPHDLSSELVPASLRAPQSKSGQ